MWSTRRESLTGGTLKFALERDSSPVPFAEVLDRWRADPDFRSFFLTLLAEAPFPAYRWETPPLTAATARRPFEFVLVDSPGLARAPDPDVFAEHFDSPGAAVVAFPNLGRDATLIVPCPVAAATAYGHLAAFVREAPEPQRHELWRAVGEEVLGRLGPAPVWLSTAGAGVPWLHVRVDSRPKYYAHAPYRGPD